MANRVPLIAGNWKMNTELEGAVQLAKELAEATKDVDPSKVELAVIPPYPFLTEVCKVIEKYTVHSIISYILGDVDLGDQRYSTKD